jgi:hypothetical protein
MCKYCDERLPDGCGLELCTDRNGFETLIYPDGKVSVSVEDVCGNRFRGYYHFNYCPMCGKPLNEPDDENVKWVVDVEGEQRWFNKEQKAIDMCEAEAAANGVVLKLYRVRIESRKTCQVVTVWE